MNTHELETVWAPRALAVLRIVAALIFVEHGTQKLLGFPPSEDLMSDATSGSLRQSSAQSVHVSAHA